MAASAASAGSVSSSPTFPRSILAGAGGAQPNGWGRHGQRAITAALRPIPVPTSPSANELAAGSSCRCFCWRMSNLSAEAETVAAQCKDCRVVVVSYRPTACSKLRHRRSPATRPAAARQAVSRAIRSERCRQHIAARPVPWYVDCSLALPPDLRSTQRFNPQGGSNGRLQQHAFGHRGRG